VARFRDIPQLVSCSGYVVNVGWDYLPHQILRHVLDHGLNLEPDFQRGYVWTASQKVRYVEFALQGGASGRDLWFNCPGWMSGEEGEYVLVDGKQRLDAVLGFLSNEFAVFGGNYFRDYTDRLRISGPCFNWHVNTLQTRDECLQWYCDLNRGGTVHPDEEIARVQSLKGHGDWERATVEDIQRYAGFSRPVLQEAIEEARQDEARRAVFQAEVAPSKKPTARKARRGR
jgi:hypothetical protein